MTGKLDDHGKTSLWGRRQPPTHCYRNAKKLDFGTDLWLVELARGHSGRQKFWHPAALQFNAYPKYRPNEWVMVGAVNMGGPIGGTYQKVRAYHFPPPSYGRYEFEGHAPDTETGVRLMLAILKEFNS